ncbi:MAG: glycogen/starch/alpha-glucan phosphorylase [Thermoanaerobaculia bacterium]
MKTIPKPEPGGLDVQSIIDAFAFRMKYSVARDAYNATELDAFQALAFAVRDRVMDRWFATQDAFYRLDSKRVYYLSMEFLLGRLLMSNIINLGAREEYSVALQRLGYTLETLAECEPDAGLGNGGLGRLAACFLESASTLSLPFYGYGIRYEYGIFRQRIIDGQQSEAPDKWLRFGNPWEVPRPDVLFPVQFYGRTEMYNDDEGRVRYRWIESQEVLAMAHDLAIPGYGTETVNSLRLWGAKSTHDFDLAKFNSGAYVAAVEEKDNTENISKVLYPPDDQYAGRELRLKQQYFFTSATIQDVVRRFKKRSRRWEELPERVAIQLNDTHPTVGIPEMMRVLIDQEAVEWELAWAICRQVFAYTNHTVLPEALEKWPLDLFGKLLPRHLEIVEEIDRRFRASVVEKFPQDETAVKRDAIIDDETQSIRMAHLAIVGSHSVNGVARLHTEILKTRVFPDFHALYPGKFNNKTNGVTPRRFLLQANPELSELITSAIGNGWPADLERLRDLEPHVADSEFRDRWRSVMFTRKNILARWLDRVHGLQVVPDWLFDVQVKRIHEYKRQILNVMHVVALYHRSLDRDPLAIVPRAVIFAGKAAPSYQIAKLSIRLIHAVGAMVRNDPIVSKRLNVVFIPNYDVSTAEMVFPATDLSEQISTAGTEASGTGCMKAVMNGAPIIGTPDGANIEIADVVGKENIFMFGHTADQIAVLRNNAEDTRPPIGKELERVISTIEQLDGGVFAPIGLILRQNDRYFHCADFQSFCETQARAAGMWLKPDEWTAVSIRNTARSGQFSSDRTVADYAREIWRVEAVTVNAD